MSRDMALEPIDPRIQPEEPIKPKLTVKEHKFIDLFLELGNATEAAMQVYGCSTRHVASTIASRVLGKVDVQSLLRERSSRAVLRIERLAEAARSEKVRLDANKDILDRAGYKARDNNPLNDALAFSLLALAQKREMLNGNRDMRVIERDITPHENDNSDPK